MKKKITEADKEQDIWFAEAKKQTVDTLSKFVKHLVEDYEHDYGTICCAVAAAALAAAHSIDHDEKQGGITGFQASCIMWEFMRQWSHVEFPAWLLKGEEMLYPQNKYRFTTISGETWEWLKKEAKEKLDTRTSAHPDVLDHWKKIADGKIPFGYKVRNDD